MPSPLLAQLSSACNALGIGKRPTVAMEIGRRPDAFLHAGQWLSDSGYEVVRVAGGNVELPASSVIDPIRRAEWSALLELYVITTARFLVCESADLQQLAYLTSTPTLRVNAREPVLGYPIRQSGLFALAQPVDADTGQRLPLSSVWSESFLVSRRGYVFRDNTGPELVQSVREMHEALEHGWTDAPSQSILRSRVESLGDEGFIGDGRLVRWQAERVA